MVIPRQKTSAAIQSAIRYLQNYQGPTGSQGGTVFLPGGDYTIDSTIFIGEDGQGYTTPGAGIRLVGAGQEKTNLKITNSSTSISAIKIKGGLDGNNYVVPSVGVVIKDLKITVASGSGHTAIENILGVGILLENVFIWGNSNLDYGIKNAAWGPNLFHFCNITGAAKAGIWLTSDTGTDSNATQIVACQVAIGNFPSLSDHVYGIHVESGAASAITGCTFNAGYSGDETYRVINIKLGANSSQTNVMNTYMEGGDIGVRIESCGNTVMNAWYGVGERFISIADGKEEGNIIMGLWNNNTHSQDPTMCQTEIANPNTLGSESLKDGDFPSANNWDATLGFSISNGKAVFYHDPNDSSTSQGFLTQEHDDMAIAGVGNRWYKFEYTVTDSNIADHAMTAVVYSFTPTVIILSLTNGTHVYYFKSVAAPDDFIIWVSTSVSGSTFKLDDLSLKEIQGGDLIVHGQIGVGTGSPAAPLDVVGRSAVRGKDNGGGGFWLSDSDDPTNCNSFVGRGNDTENMVGFYSNGDWRLAIPDSSGYVGIGCTSPVSKLEIAGSLGVKVVSKSAAYTAADETVILVDASGGNVTITLPPASTVTGRVYYIKRTSGTGGTVSIAGNSSEMIDDANIQYLPYQYDCLQIASFGSAWHILAQVV